MPEYTWNKSKIWEILTTKTSTDAIELISEMNLLLPKVEDILRHGATSPKDFTLHDNEHSYRVVQRMGTIIPVETLGTLNEFELTFLILTSYLHDIGMTPKLEKVHNHEKFLKFGEELLSDMEVQEFQKWIDDSDYDVTIPICNEDKCITTEGDNIANEILKYYIRHKHNDWSAEWIQNSEQMSTMKMRNYHGWRRDLIEVCKSHHYGIDELKKEKFDPVPAAPGKAVHLRYIAMCLRMADVMEIDPERTPDVILRHRSITEQSITYWEKDAAMVLNINKDSERGHLNTTVSALPPHAYLHKAVLETVAQIDQELKTCYNLGIIKPLNVCPFLNNSLTHKWHLLPEVISTVRPKDESYVYIEGAFKPNTKKILQILAGTELYGNPMLAVRELLQNAFDAVKEQVAIERLEKNNPADKKWETLIGDEHLVCLTLEKHGDSFWLVCTDDGVGMSKNIIDKYLLVSGSSKRSYIHELERKCEEMGFKLERTGQFGIGVLSYFMIAKRVIIKTRRSAENYEITGWQFQINGVSDFGELRKIDFKKGTEVALEIPPALYGKEGFEKWELQMIELIKSTVRRIPCKFIFKSNITKQRFEWSVGWVDRTEIIKAELGKGFEYEVQRSFALKNHPEFISNKSQIRNAKRTELFLMLSKEMQDSLRMETYEGYLPYDAGQYKIYLPVFNIAGLRSLLFLKILSREDYLEVVSFANGYFYYAAPFAIQASWKGIYVELTEEWRKLSDNTMAYIEADLTNSKLVSIEASRNSLAFRDYGEEIVNFLNNRLDQIYIEQMELIANSPLETLHRCFFQFSPRDLSNIWWIRKIEDSDNARLEKLIFPFIMAFGRYYPIPDAQLHKGKKLLRRYSSTMFSYSAMHDISFDNLMINPDRIIIVNPKETLPICHKLYIDGVFVRSPSKYYITSTFPDDWERVVGIRSRFGTESGRYIINKKAKLLNYIDDELIEKCRSFMDGDFKKEDIIDFIFEDKRYLASLLFCCLTSANSEFWNAFAEKYSNLIQENFCYFLPVTLKKEDAILFIENDEFSRVVAITETSWVTTDMESSGLSMSNLSNEWIIEIP